MEEQGSPTEDYKKLTMRLIGAMQYGFRIESLDGHRWVRYQEPDWRYPNIEELMIEKGISLNDKIYGGYDEALEVIDDILLHLELRKTEDVISYEEDSLFYKSNTRDSRIDINEPGKGGIY